MSPRPATSVNVVTLQRRGHRCHYHLAAVAVVFAVAAHSAPASAQQGGANYASELGYAAADQARRLPVPYDARASVAASRAVRHRVVRQLR